MLNSLLRNDAADPPSTPDNSLFPAVLAQNPPQNHLVPVGAGLHQVQGRRSITSAYTLAECSHGT
jgi:hypothetical protein